MKKLLTLLFGVLVCLPALCQLADVQLKNNIVGGQTIKTIETVNRLWNNSKQIPAIPGTSYSWVTPGDTAYYFVPPAGQNIYITVQFSAVPTEPNPPPTLKEIQDNTAATYRNASGVIETPVVNAYNTTVWNNFNKLVTPFPAWCDVFHLKTSHFAYTTNYTATFSFIGKKFELIGEKSENKGIVGVKIDGGSEMLVDLYANTAVNNSQVIYWSDVPNGSHTVTVRITGNKNAASSNTNLLIDALKVYE